MVQPCARACRWTPRDGVAVAPAPAFLITDRIRMPGSRCTGAQCRLVPPMLIPKPQNPEVPAIRTGGAPYPYAPAPKLPPHRKPEHGPARAATPKDTPNHTP